MSKTPRVSMSTMLLSRLRLSPTNVKTHPPEQIAQLRASIREFGFRDPIGVTPTGEIIEGHGRYAAAMEEGLTEVPVLILAGLSPRELRAYAIAHNQTTTNSGLDLGLVKVEVERMGLDEDELFAMGLNGDDLFFAGLDTNAAKFDYNGAEKQGQTTSAVASTKLLFDTADQYVLWMQFVEASRTRYDGATIAERLMQFLSEHDHAR